MAINARKEERKKELEKTRPSVKEQIRQQLDADLGRTTTATTSSGGGAKTTTTSGGTTKASGQTSSVKADIRALLDADLGRTTKKDKWASFWKGVGKNVKAGATDSSLKNQAQYYAHNDPIKEKYRYNTVVNGKESTFTVDQSLNPGYHTSRFLDRALDPQHRVGRESNQGTIYTQEEANRDIQALDEYRARQDVRDYEADAATQQALQTIDPDTKVGQIAVAASMGVARTLPSLAKDAALTATTAGLLGAAGFGKTAIRLAKEIPTLTVRTLRYYDDAFQNALDNGATEEQAVRAAMQTALPNAAIESAGGLDALAGRMVGATGKAASKATRVLRAAEVPLSEGLEEVAQGIVERGAAARNYDESAVAMDLQQIVNDFALGAAGGAILGSAMGILRRGLNANSQQELEAAMEERGVPPQTAAQASAAMLDAISKRTAPPTPPTTAEQGMSLISNAAQTAEPKTNAERGASLIENSVHDWRAAMQQPEQSKSTNGRLVFSETPTENAGKTASNPEEVQTTASTRQNAAEPLASGENGTGNVVEVRGLSRNDGLIVPKGAGPEQEYEFTSNTLHNAAEAGIIDEQVEKDLASGVYATVHNEQSLAQAQAAIDKNGADTIEQHLLRVNNSSRNMNSTEYAAALTLIKQFSDAGEYDRATTMAEAARNASNDAGRLLQLTKTMMRSSPQMYVIHATRQLRDAGIAISESRQELLRAIADAAQKAEKGEWDGTIDLSNVKTINAPQGVGIVANPAEPDIKEDPGVTEKEKAAIKKIEDKIKAKNKNGESKVAANTGISESDWLTMLGAATQARPINAGYGEFITSWRRIAMLLNPKTLIVRNIGGNALNLATEMASDPWAALVGQGLKKLTGGDVSAVQAGKLKYAGSGFLHGLNASWFAYRNGLLDQLGGNKYTNDSASQGRLFGANEKWPARAYRGLNDTVSFGLTVLDKCFSQARQDQILAQYQQANGGAELTEQQKALAEEGGKYVTFQNDSALAWLAVSLRGLGEKLQAKAIKDDWDMGGRVAAGMLNAALKLEIPFAKTPGNILNAAINLTPIGLANSILEITDEALGQHTLQNMSMTRQRRIAMGIGRSITGAALFAAGVLLYNRGQMSGDTPDDEMEEDIWSMLGKIPHAVKVGDNWWDLSSLGPSLVLLNLGATLAEELKDDLDSKSILKLFKTCVFQSTSEVMSDITGDNLWSGIIDLADNIKNIEEEGLSKLLYDVAGDAVSQIVPFSSALRQFAYTFDEYVRETSAEDEAGWIINKQRAGLPSFGKDARFGIGSKSLPKKVGITGEETVRYPNAKTGAGRAVNAFLNPASTISEDRSDEDWLQELARLARATDKKDLVLEKAPYSLTGTDGKYKLFGEERALYQKTYSTEVNQFMDELLGNDAYEYLPVEKQASIVSQLMDLSEYAAKQAVDRVSDSYTVSPNADGTTLLNKLDEAAEAKDANGNRLNIDAVTYLIGNGSMANIDAKDKNGNTIDGLGKARKAVAAKQSLPSMGEQAYWIWKNNGNGFADKDNFYYYYFTGQPWRGHVYTDEEVINRIMNQ